MTLEVFFGHGNIGLAQKDGKTRWCGIYFGNLVVMTIAETETEIPFILIFIL